MNHVKLAFERIREVRALVKSDNNAQAIQMAQELLQYDYIPAFSRRYLEHIVYTKAHSRHSLCETDSSLDSNEPDCGTEKGWNQNIYEPHYDLIKNGNSLVGILNNHGMHLINIIASLNGRIDFVAISWQDFHRVSFCLNQTVNGRVCSEAKLTRLSPTSQEIKVVFNDIDISDKYEIEVQYSLQSSPLKSISVRSKFFNPQSFCPVALACSDAKRPRHQDISNVNLHLLRYELSSRTNALKHMNSSKERLGLYCVDVRDTSFSIRNIMSKDPYLYENQSIIQIESLINEFEPGSIFLLKDSSILLREDISQFVESLVATESQHLLTKAIFLDHLIKVIDNNDLLFTNYEITKGLCWNTIPSLNVRVKTCLLSVGLLSDTLRKVELCKKETLDQNSASFIDMIVNTLIETNKALFFFKSLIGIQYLPTIPAEEKRLFQQAPHHLLEVNSHLNHHETEAKDIGVIRLDQANSGDVEYFDHQLDTKIIDIDSFTPWKHQGSRDKYPGTLHHGQILIDADRLTSAIRLSGVSYISFIHPDFELGYPRYCQDQVALMQRIPLCISVSPHMYERRSQESGVTKIIMGETFECLQATCIRITPESYPAHIAKGLIPIQVPPLIGTLFDAQHVVKALSSHNLCSSREIQALLAVHAHKNGYHQILSSHFHALYTSTLPYSLFGDICEDASRKVSISGVLGKLPLICTSFKAKHD